MLEKIGSVFADPLGTLTALLLIEGGVLLLSEWRPLRRVFDIAPSMFWIYFLPIVASNLKLIPNQSGVYDSIQSYVLPACLILLLLSVDMRAIWRLGGTALAVMLAGSLGILVGGPIVLLLFGPLLPPAFAAEAWRGFGCLSASWTGGSANMIAVRDCNATPGHIFAPMQVVDTIVPYVWMGTLIFFSSHQRAFDRWNKSRMELTEHLSRRAGDQSRTQRPLTVTSVAMLFLAAVGGTLIAVRVGGLLPAVPNMIAAKAWVIIVASILGVALSFTPARRLEEAGASRLGYFLLYLVLTSIGAQTRVVDLGTVPVLIAAGLVWVLIHALFTLVAGRLLHAPMALQAAASQANVGGVASAPVVAGVYDPALAPVGLLLAIFGNVIGTYIGVLCSSLCRWVS